MCWASSWAFQGAFTRARIGAAIFWPCHLLSIMWDHAIPTERDFAWREDVYLADVRGDDAVVTTAYPKSVSISSLFSANIYRIFSIKKAEFPSRSDTRYRPAGVSELGGGRGRSSRDCLGAVEKSFPCRRCRRNLSPLRALCRRDVSLSLLEAPCSLERCRSRGFHRSLGPLHMCCRTR